MMMSAPRWRSKASSARGLPTECLTTEWPQRKGSTGKGLIQSNSSGLLKRLPHQALLEQLADRQPAQIGRADPGRTRQFVELAPALRLQLDFKSRRGVVCHAAKIRPPAEFPFNAPAFRRRSDAAQRPWQLRRRQKRAPAGAEAKVVLTPEAASHARHQHPYMARQLRRRYEQDGRASGPAATTACIDDAARCCIPCKRQQPDGRRPP